MRRKPVKTYAFVDASNLFYGGEKSLGWKIDYEKLLGYLKNKYGVSKAFYYAGVELNGFNYSVLRDKEIDLEKLLVFHKKKKSFLKYIQRIKFYRKLKKFGYTLRLKPTKIFRDGGRVVKKANCDVDLTFDAMRFINDYRRIVLLSGDGDFAVLVMYLIDIGKSVMILARGERTAKEIRQIAAERFADFVKLRKALEFVPK